MFRSDNVSTCCRRLLTASKIVKRSRPGKQCKTLICSLFLVSEWNRKIKGEGNGGNYFEREKKENIFSAEENGNERKKKENIRRRKIIVTSMATNQPNDQLYEYQQINVPLEGKFSFQFHSQKSSPKFQFSYNFHQVQSQYIFITLST